MTLRQASSLAELAFYPHGDLVWLSGAPRLWNINAIRMDGVATTVEGWCLPHGGLLGNLRLSVNGQPLPMEQLPANGAYTDLYPWFPNAAWSGFRVTVPHAVRDLRGETELEFEPIPAGSAGTRYYTLNVLVKDLAHSMPPADIAARIGATNLMDYVMLGRSIFRGFEAALHRNFGSSFADFPQVLDWGCGSGRVGRHTIRALGSSAEGFLGLDIDRHAVEWSNANIGPHFRTCATQPPLPVAEESIDLVYAYSVFTHLSDENLQTWTAEISRVLKPDGVFLVTVLSDRATMALFSNPTRKHMEDWRRTGIHDSAKNNQLDDIDVPKDYYRNVWLTRDYIDRLIAGKFEIVEYVGSFHFYQDLLVLRRL